MTDDNDEPNGPQGVAGGASPGIRLAPPTNVQSLRMPGTAPPEAHAVALERLLEAMCLCGTINRDAATAYLMALKLTGVSAPYGEHGIAVAKLLTGYQKRLEAHLATVPNRPPPSVA